MIDKFILLTFSRHIMFNFLQKKPSEEEIASKLVEYIDLIIKYSKNLNILLSKYLISTDQSLRFVINDFDKDSSNIEENIENILNDGQKIKKLNNPNIVVFHKKFQKINALYSKLITLSLDYANTQVKLYLEPESFGDDINLLHRRLIQHNKTPYFFPVETQKSRYQLKLKITGKQIYDTAQETYQHLLDLTEKLNEIISSNNNTQILNVFSKINSINLKPPYFKNMNNSPIIALSSLDSDVPTFRFEIISSCYGLRGQ